MGDTGVSLDPTGPHLLCALVRLGRRLAPMRYLAKTLRRHLENILTYLTHRITNAVTEGLDAKIQWIKYSSRGLRDRERLKLAIYFHCGGLDLEPRAEKILST